MTNEAAHHSSMLLALLFAATRAATDAEIRQYSQATVARLQTDPKCRSVYGPPSNTSVATPYDAFPLTKRLRSDEICRCGATDGAPALPRVRPSALEKECHLVFRLPCEQTRGWSCAAVDEVWLTSIPKVGSQSISETYKALRLNETLRGWQPPKRPCLEQAGRRVRRVALVRDPWTKCPRRVPLHLPRERDLGPQVRIGGPRGPVRERRQGHVGAVAAERGVPRGPAPGQAPGRHARGHGVRVREEPRPRLRQPARGRAGAAERARPDAAS